MKKYLNLVVPVLYVTITVVLFLTQVDLEPEISENFFFSSQSKIFKENMLIEKKYPSTGQSIFLIVPVAKGSLKSKNYIQSIRSVTSQVKKIKGVSGVLSLVSGPDEIEEGISNPLWSKVLVSKDKKNSFVIFSVDPKHRSSVVGKVQGVIESISSYKIRIAGVPYFNEQMKKNIVSDMKVFTVSSIVLCSLILFVFFRSFKTLIFSIIVCSTSAAATLVALSLYGKGIGILTANLLIIAYVLSLSHFIFLTSNYKRVGYDSTKIREVIKQTFISSSWCMLTTFLGFLSLVFVEAKPLKELGEGGIIAAVAALVTVYLVYGSLLFLYNKKSSDKRVDLSKLYNSKKFSIWIASLFVLITVGFGSIGISKLETDPSLLDYFEENGEIYKQLNYLNENGGSNALKLEIQLKNLNRLDNEESYIKMQKLHEKISKNTQVGTVLSLPVLMAESNEHWAAKLLPWNIILNLLESKKYDSITKSFVSEDRKSTLFTLRMIEGKSKQVDRLKVVSELEKIVEANGFKVKKRGGTYYLQGELAKLVRESLITGLASLCVIFAVIILIISKSSLTAFFVFFFSASTVIIIFGILGVVGIPIDIISSPAINIALGIAVDSIIHITRDASKHKNKGWKGWSSALRNQAYPAMASMIIVAIGFSSFVFSSFPPSFRFGIIVLIGILLSIPLSINIIPLSSRFRR